MREVELKGVVPDPEATIAALRAAGAVLQLDGSLLDRRYDTPERTLVARDHVLRVRIYRDDAGTTASLDVKGPTMVQDGYKIREEYSTSAGDPAALVAMLELLGYVVTREIDRHITQFALAGATVRIERYPRMDVLAEVEGTPAAIEHAIAATGIPRDAFTSERLSAFASRYELRTGERAALCARELAGDYRFASVDG
jgi:adenylate cyclase class IV